MSPRGKGLPHYASLLKSPWLQACPITIALAKTLQASWGAMVAPSHVTTLYNVEDFKENITALSMVLRGLRAWPQYVERPQSLKKKYSR